MSALTPEEIQRMQTLPPDWQRELRRMLEHAAANPATNPPAPGFTGESAHAANQTTCSKCGIVLPDCPNCAAAGTPPSIQALPPSRGDGQSETLFDKIRRDNADFAATAHEGFAIKVERP